MEWKVLHWGDRGQFSNLPITFLGFPAGFSPNCLSVVSVFGFFVRAEVLHWVAQPLLHRLPLVRVRTLKRWRPEGFGQRYEWSVGGDGR
jgi:hypothetical protein